VAFLALCKVGFVSGFCVPCNVLKIGLGRVGKVRDVWIYVGCSNRVTYNTLIYAIRRSSLKN